MSDYDSRLHQKRNISGVEIDDVRERYTNPVDFDTRQNLPKYRTLSGEKLANEIAAHKPDLVIIDYVDYLRAPSRGKSFERKDEIDDVFIATKGLAKELKIPILTPSQVNRMGARDSVIEGDKAAGSYDKMMVADICLSLSRQKEDKVLGTGRVHVMKNRYGQDGMTYNVKMDTNNGHIEFDGKADPAELLEDDSKPKFTISREAMDKLL